MALELNPKFAVFLVAVIIIAAIAVAWTFLPGMISGTGAGTAKGGAQNAGLKAPALSLAYIYPSMDRIKAVNSGSAGAENVYVAIDGRKIGIAKAECFRVNENGLGESIANCANPGNSLEAGQSKIFTLGEKIGVGKTIELGCDSCAETGTVAGQKVHVLP